MSDAPINKEQTVESEKKTVEPDLTETAVVQTAVVETAAGTEQQRERAPRGPPWWSRAQPQPAAWSA